MARTKKSADSLNEMEARFAEEYIIDLNATKAAMRAGYSPKTAYSIGCRLLKKVEIRSRIEKLIEERSTRTLIHADYVVESLKEVVERALEHKPVLEFNPSTKRMVQKTASIEEDGETKVVGVYEFDGHSANRALELLGKHLGLFEKDNSQKAKFSVEIT